MQTRALRFCLEFFFDPALNVKTRIALKSSPCVIAVYC